MEKLYSYKNIVDKGWRRVASCLFLAFLAVSFLNMALLLTILRGVVNGLVSRNSNNTSKNHSNYSPAYHTQVVLMESVHIWHFLVGRLFLL